MQRSVGAKYTVTSIGIILTNRLGKKVRVKCLADDSIGDFKRILAAQIGTPADKISEYGTSQNGFLINVNQLTISS